MKRWRNLSLNLKLLACFIAAIFLLSIFHLISYLRLLNTMTLEAQTSEGERMNSAVTRLDENLARIGNEYFSLTYTPAFRQASRTATPSEYDLVDLARQASLNLNNMDEILAYAIFFGGTEQVVTSSGNYLDETFFTRIYASDTYDVEFWRQEKQAAFSQRTYPAAAYDIHNPPFDSITRELLPVAYKSFWNANAMVLLFLDAATACEQADLYLTEDFYIFGPEGELLYTPEAQPALATAPDSEETFFQLADGSYVAKRESTRSGFTYVKTLPKNKVVGQITRSLYASIAIALVAFLLGIGIAVVSVRRLMHPVRDILQLFSSQAAEGTEGADELRYIQANVEQMLRQREQYVQQLTKKDEALSGFLLQSQLKNIYVDLDLPDQTLPAGDITFYILYLRIHYRQGALDNISAEPSAVAHLFLETLQKTLNHLFDTALIFQLEPNQFVAKISLPRGSGDIEEQMRYLLHRLDHESEFAFFTIVQSAPLTADADFAAVYDEVLNAAQYAGVQSETQRLNLPLDIHGITSFAYPAEQEHRLRALVGDGQAEQAAALAGQIIRANLSAGIRRVHMVLLCSAIVNTALRGLSELHPPGGVPDLDSRGIVNRLPGCGTGPEYEELTTGFVEKAAAAAAGLAPAADPILQGVRLYVEENYSRDFSMDELADALHLSKSYLSTYYKANTGTNLSDHIQYYRVQKAIGLLADPGLRVGDIGERVGIANPNTFLRQFKKYTGMTPKEYRLRKLSIK